MMLRSLVPVLIGLAAAGPLAAETLTCTLGKATLQARVDPAGRTVDLANARNTKTQHLTAQIVGSELNFSDGEEPVALLYTINRQSLRIDRWISDGSEGRTHLDDGKCRAGQYAEAAAPEPFKAP